MTAEIDRARLIAIAERIRRSARHPDVIALCDGVLALAVAPPKPVSLTSGRASTMSATRASTNTVRSSSSISFSLHVPRFARLLILPLALEAKKKPQREPVVRYLSLGGKGVPSHGECHSTAP
jgi:hypothetical protein